MRKNKVYYSNLFNIPTSEFWDHLNMEDNSRILFSGMFGVGKSTFINHFFNEEVTKPHYIGKKKYKVIHLYPVNYTISTNEDIFKYIKVDILNYILKNYPGTVDSTTFSFSTIASYMIAHKMGHLIPAFFLLFGQIGETSLLFEMGAPEAVSKTAGVFQPLFNMLDKFNKKYKELEEGANELKKINEFLGDETHKEGSPYELNFITNLIIDLVKRLKEEGIQKKNETDKPDEIETVLIIDDMDRLDPGHVFRLFNIFAAHLNDEDELQNKFGFNKVMFVGDVANVRRLYTHFYGASSSFNGYIDKFYSNRIFYFDNTESVRSIVRTVVNDLEIKSDKTNSSNGFSIEQLKSNLSIILSFFLKNGSISLRSLLKLRNPIAIRVRNIITDLRVKTNIHHSIAIEFDILVQLLR